jgi:hypothetical protein
MTCLFGRFHQIRKNQPTTMKLQYLILSAALLALPGCEQKQTPTDKVKVNDVLDRLVGEKVRDISKDVVK